MTIPDTMKAGYHAGLLFAYPSWLSVGRLKCETLDATLVKPEADAAQTGWGDGAPRCHTYFSAQGPRLGVHPDKGTAGDRVEIYA